MTLSRLVPNRHFPSYAYIPLRWPHPTRDSKGHSYGEGDEKVEPLDPKSWRQCQTYLYGIDLFNYGYYWEAHDAWESIWLACGRKGVTGDFLKGLIKLAAAGVKAREGRTQRVQQQAKRAEELFRQTAGSVGSQRSRYMGFSLAQLIGFAGRLRVRSVTASNKGDNSVKIVFRFKLRPLL